MPPKSETFRRTEQTQNPETGLYIASGKSTNYIAQSCVLDWQLPKIQVTCSAFDFVFIW
jgi:hypothetical protein